MNLTMWTAIREYIAAEIKLALARQDGNAFDIQALEAQSTRMETAVRGMLDDSGIDPAILAAQRAQGRKTAARASAAVLARKRGESPR